MPQPRRTVIFADNDSDFRDVYSIVLERNGYRVLQAHSTSEALKHLDSEEVDVVILDVRLVDDYDEQDFSGFSLARDIAGLIPVIVLTGHDPTAQTFREALSTHTVGFVKKEEGTAALLREVDRAITKQEQRVSGTHSTAVQIPELPRPTPPDNLVKACQQGNCVAFIGAGLSKPAAYPAWQELVEDLLQWAVHEGIVDYRLEQSYSTALRSGDLYVAADGIIHTIYENDAHKASLQAHLAKIFLEPSVQPTEIHHILARVPLVGILTSNLDTLIEHVFDKARVYTPQDTKELTAALAQREVFILKLSGDLSKPDTVQITPAQYGDTISNNRAHAQFIQNLFFARTVLFLGASLDGLIANLEALQCRSSSRQHYALVSVSDAEWQAKAELLQKRYNVRVLPYRTSKTHPEVLAFVQSLLSEVIKKGRLRDTRRQIRAPRLKRVHLVNIGPFDELKVELHPHWNTLLGDNGVGKSNILRAIAFALCGEDARPYAHRMLKIDKPSGRITLELTDGSINVVELYRTNTGVDLVLLTQRALVNAEKWLAIGFPPLRNVDWKPVSGPHITDSAPYAASSDLLPLLVSAIDPRINDLKQTIINLDYRSEKETHADSRHLLKDMFDVVGQTAEGMVVRLAGTDPNTRQITLVTDSGKVPIEAVSQGTQSLMGWIIIMLQRLHEVYEESRQPKREPALVMVDEIDAHMHPAWQRTIAPHLMKLFPNVQFIVTTHSPLILGGARPGTVIRLRRDEAMPAKIIADRPIIDVRRWRTEQILTSPLFDLPTTLTPEMADALRDYTTLVTRGNLSREETERLEHCADLLRVRPPTPLETQLARDAFERIEAALDAQLQDIPPERKNRLLEEIKAQVQENITGSRRPL